MTHAHGCAFSGCRIVADSVRPSIEGNATLVWNGVVAHDVAVFIGVADSVSIDVHHGGIIGKPAIAPFPADESDSHIAIAVVDSAVISNLVAPIALMKDVAAIIPAPPGWSPHCSFIRSGYPFAGNPVISIVVIRPIARRPHPAFFRARRLVIDRQFGGRKIDGDRDLSSRSSRNEEKQKYWQKPERTSRGSHVKSSLDSRSPA